MVTADVSVAGARTAFWPVLINSTPSGVTTCLPVDPSPQSDSSGEELRWIAAELNAAVSDEAARDVGAYITSQCTPFPDSYFLGLHCLSARMKMHANQCSSFNVDRRWLLCEQLMILVALWQSASHHRLGLTTGAMTIATDAPQVLFLPVASQLLGCRIAANLAYAEGSLPGICSYKVPIISIAPVETDRVPLASRTTLGAALCRLKSVLCWNRTLEKMIEFAHSSLNNQPVQGFIAPIHSPPVNPCAVYGTLLEHPLGKPVSDLNLRMQKVTQSSIVVFYDDNRCGDAHGDEPTANSRSGSAQGNAEAWPATGDELVQHPETATDDRNNFAGSEGCAYSLDALQGVSFSKDKLHSLFLGKRKPPTCGPH